MLSESTESGFIQITGRRVYTWYGNEKCSGKLVVVKKKQYDRYIRVGFRIFAIEQGMWERTEVFNRHFPSGSTWRISIYYNNPFVLKYATGQCTPSPKAPTFDEHEWQLKSTKSEVEYTQFLSKWKDFVAGVESIEKESRSTRLHFHCGSALRSVKACLGNSRCQFVPYGLIMSKLDDILPLIKARPSEANLKNLLILANELAMVVQHLHEYYESEPQRILDKLVPSRPPKKLPWLTPSYSVPLLLSQIYQSQYNWQSNSIKIHSSSIRPDLTSAILNWWSIPSSEQTPALLITGDGGVGKSTLVSAICDQFNQIHRLHASFLFNAKHGSSDMALQLFGNVAAELSPWTDKKLPLNEGELEQFVLQPPYVLIGSRLVVIDAIDECEVHHRRDLVQKLANAIPRLPSNYRLLITSRHEDDSLDPLLHLPNHELHRIDMNQLDESTKELLTTSLSTTFGNLPWIHSVVSKSGGLPRFAMTACRFIMDGDESSLRQRLDLVLNLSPNDGQSPLFALYFAILSFLFQNAYDQARFKHTITRVMLCREPHSIDDHNNLISMGTRNPAPSFDTDVLSEIGPLIGMDHNEHMAKPIQISERSFTEFITDRDESHQFFIDLNNGPMHLQLADECVNFLIRSLPGSSSVAGSLKKGLLSYAVNLWPRHVVNSLSYPSDGVEQALKRFTLHHSLYWAAAATAMPNVSFRGYIPQEIKDIPSQLLVDFITRLESFVRSQRVESECRIESFKRSFTANRAIPHICSNDNSVVYGRTHFLFYHGLLKTLEISTLAVQGQYKQFVTCPALLRFGSTTLLACIRSYETKFLQVRTVGGKIVYEDPIHGRVVELLNVGSHIVAVYETGSMEQFTFAVDLRYIRPREEPKVTCTATRQQIPKHVQVQAPSCNLVKRITACNPATGSTAFTFNCGTDRRHRSACGEHGEASTSAETEVAFWNCKSGTGRLLKLPRGIPVISYMMFDRTRKADAEDKEHLVAVTAAGSAFVWRIEATEYTLLGEFTLPKDLNLPRLHSFECYSLERPALELFSFKWEDGTVALYDKQGALLQRVRVAPVIRVPWEELDVEEANPEDIDPEESRPTNPSIFYDLHWHQVVLLLFALAAILYGLLLVF